LIGIPFEGRMAWNPKSVPGRFRLFFSATLELVVQRPTSKYLFLVEFRI
jgi:hypothetical protein